MISQENDHEKYCFGAEEVIRDDQADSASEVELRAELVRIHLQLAS
jgi:hypothetical protein